MCVCVYVCVCVCECVRMLTVEIFIENVKLQKGQECADQI